MIYVWRRAPWFSPEDLKHYGSHQCWYVMSQGKKTKCWQGYKENEPDSDKFLTLSQDEQKTCGALAGKVRNKLKVS